MLRTAARVSLVLTLPAVLAACAARAVSPWNLADGGRAEKIEMALGPAAQPLEVEYHLPAEAVPPAVHAAMEARHPGGTVLGAEKEVSGGRLYWELAKEIEGYKVEAMFRPDGTLYEEEIEIPEAQVPAAVRDATRAAWPDGRVKAWEVIRDARGAIVEYHVKLDSSGRAVKAIVAPGGTVRGARYEVPAEIEVPFAVPRAGR